MTPWLRPWPQKRNGKKTLLRQSFKIHIVFTEFRGLNINLYSFFLVGKGISIFKIIYEYKLLKLYVGFRSTFFIGFFGRVHRSGSRPYSPHYKGKYRPYPPHYKGKYRPYSPHYKGKYRPYSPHYKGKYRPYSPHYKGKYRPFSPHYKGKSYMKAPFLAFFADMKLLKRLYVYY